MLLGQRNNPHRHARYDECIKGLRTKSSLLRALKHLRIRTVFWAIEDAILPICISNISLLSRTIHNNFMKVEVSDSTPQKDNGG